MKFKKYLLGGLVSSVLILCSLSAQAVIFSLDPVYQTAQPGDTVQIDLMADLEGATLGAYDVDILYDATALSFVSGTNVALGPDPLDPAWDTVLYGVLDDSIGTVDIFDVSLFLPADLTSYQSSGSIVLANLFFSVDVLAEGASTFLNIDATDLFLYAGDENGDLLAINGLNGAEIHRPGSGVPVPEPGALSLMLLGLAGLGLRKRLRC